MNYRSTYILFGLVLVVLVLLTVALWRSPAPEPSRFALPVLQDKANPVTQNQITRVEITRGSDKITLSRNDKTWKVNQYRASEAAINHLLSQLFNAQREQVDKPASPKDWGLAPPEGNVKLFKEGDQPIAQLDLGSKGPGGTLYVLDPSRADDPMAVPLASVDSVLGSVNTFRERTLLGTAATMTGIALSEGDHKLALRESNGTWHFAPPTAFTGLASSEVTEKRNPKGAPTSVPILEQDLVELQPGPVDASSSDFVADDVPPADFAKYYLDPAKNKVLTITVSRGKEGEAKSDSVVLIGLDKTADDKGEKYYARLVGENSVVRVPAKPVKALLALLDDPEALRDYHLVRFGPGQSIDAIQIELKTLPSPNVLEFYKPGMAGGPDLNAATGWQFYIGDKAEALDDAYLKGLIDLLLQDNVVTSFPPDDKGSGLDKPQVVIKLYTGAVTAPAAAGQKPGLRADAKPVILSFAAPEKPSAWARREQNGVVTNLRVKDVVRERVGEGPLMYRSKALPHYKEPGDTKSFESKVVIQRNGVTTTLTRAKADDKWKFVTPEKLAPYEVNSRAVLFLLQDLNNLKAERLVTEKADPGTLKEYDLGDGRGSQVTITVTGEDGKTTDHVYQFGKDADASSVYAKQGNRDLVFTVSKASLAPLNAEFRDTTIFKFDPEKVNRVDIVIGGLRPTLMHFEKKDNQWTDKDAPKATVDPEKMKSMLAQLNGFQATRFLPDAPDPVRYGLETKAGSLEINIYVEGEAKPYSLTVGRTEGTDSYAISNRLPEDASKPRELFLVPNFWFTKEMLRNPEHLFKE